MNIVDPNLADELEPQCCSPTPLWQLVGTYVLGIIAIAMLGVTAGGVLGLSCRAFDYTRGG